MPFPWDVARLAAVVYFIQGALGIASIALPLYMRAEGFSVARIALIASASTAPWFFKIVYGAISDAIPIGGLRRKPYLIICSLLSSVGWVLLCLLPPGMGYLIVGMSVANLGLAATDVITDGLVVEHSMKGRAQMFQGISWGARGLGSVIAGVSGGVLAAHYPARLIFLLTSALPLVSLGVVFWIRESRCEGRDVHGNILLPIIGSVRKLVHGDFKWFALLLLIASCSAAIGTPLFFYMREQLQFDEVFLGLLSSVAWLGAVIGCGIFLQLWRRVALKTALYWTIGFAFLDILLTLLIQSRTTAFAITLFSGVLGCMTLLPLLSSAASLAHGTGVEGSLFAVLASLYNIGLAGSGFGGGVLYEWIGLKALIVLTAFFVLSGLLVIPKLKTL